MRAFCISLSCSDSFTKTKLSLTSTQTAECCLLLQQCAHSAAVSAQSSVYVVDDPGSVCTVVDGVVKTELPPASINFACTDGKMHNASTWLGIAGLMLMGILMSRSFKGSIITGLVYSTQRH